MIVRGRDQLLFSAIGDLAAPHEPVTPLRILDLAAHGFSGLASDLIQSPPPLGHQDSLHLVAHGQVLGDPPLREALHK
jgi:hypothetical protein